MIPPLSYSGPAEAVLECQIPLSELRALREQRELILAPARETPELFRVDIYLFICNNCFTYRRERLAYY